ncbi:hypothetical protein ACFUN7_27875 [Streptomyces sp. NPDC057236]|uniref:lectin-like domain-containing protein n=1 Tax=Streptomyces sp. NPDC057236 TaxID=3346059 RepID=UPI003638D61E
MVTQATPEAGTDSSVFPITESFSNSTTDNSRWRILGSAVLNGSLQLTPNAKQTSGTALLDEAFPSSYGVAIDFAYEVEPGSTPGDGFSVYLIDGSATTGPGATGAGLGYSRTERKRGVTQGYIGIGFDHYGNYASDLAGPRGPGRTPNMVGIRGSGNHHDGFAWLTGMSLKNSLRTRWEEGARVQVTVADGRITVRMSSKTDPNGTTVIDGFPLQSDGQAPMPDTFKIGLSASTGDATAAHRIRNLKITMPADMPLEITGPAEAEAGTKVCYPIVVRNDGPNDAPDAVVEAQLPAELSNVTFRVTTGSGAVEGKGTVANGVLRQPLGLPKDATTTVTVCGTVNRAFTGTLTLTATITSTSRSNISSRPHGETSTQVTHAAEPTTDLVVSQDSGVRDAPGGPGAIMVIKATSRETGHPVAAGPVEHVFTAPTGFRWNGHVSASYRRIDKTTLGGLPPVEAKVGEDGRTLTFTYDVHVCTGDDDRDYLVYTCGTEAVDGVRPHRYTDGIAQIGAAPPAQLKATLLPGP